MNLEDFRHFEIGGNADADDADISITCLRCPDWNQWIAVSTDEDGVGVLLSELIKHAERHVESCPGALHLTSRSTASPSARF
jgi:hypothetical protein